MKAIKTWRQTLLNLLLLAAFGTPAWAQPRQDKQQWEGLQQVKVGQKVDVTVHGKGSSDWKEVRGEWVSVSDIALTIRSKKADKVIPRDDVLEVRVRKSSGRWKNVAIGAGLGAGAGLGVGAASLAASGGCDGCGAVLAVMPLLGGAIGAVAGMMAHPHDTLYKRPKS